MEPRWLPVSLVVWITTLALTLDARQQARFIKLCTGLLFARSRRTVTSWLRGCGAGRDFKRYYYLLGSVGRKTPALAAALLRIVRKTPGRGAGRAAGLRHRRLPHQAVWPADRGRRQASQPHPGAGRVPVPPRPRLGLLGPTGPTPDLGGDRPADPLASVHPGQGCCLDGGLLRLAVPHQARVGRRPDPTRI
jgi:hypothetical protein